ncbi:MAG: ABC transporter substrate-binding protein [Geminicoccaceae bacterium]
MAKMLTGMLNGTLKAGTSGTLAAGVVAVMIGDASADGHLHVVATDPFGPQAGWALETDDAFILTRAGCLETLTRRDADGSLQPGLAEAWTRHSPTEWDFKIRSGVTFQDGTALTAEIVGDALNKLLTATAPPRPFSPKRIAGVTVVDESTVRITTPNPSVLTPMRVAAPNTGILSPAAYEEEMIDPVGHCTGPFEITEHVAQQALKLKRSDTYWGEKAILEGGELRFIPEGSGRATQLKSGEAQISLRLPISEVLSLQSASGIEVQTIEQTRTTGLYLNNKKAPFDNEKVRLAVQSAIDTSTIAATIYEGAARPAVGPFGPGDLWAPADAEVVPFDKEKALAHLKEAGVDPASIKVTLNAYVERAELPDLAAVIQAQLGDIGIGVELKVANYSAIEPDLLSGDYDMFVLSRGYLSDVADPIGFLTADYSCDGGYNLSHFCDPAIDEKIDAASAVEDDAERYALYKDIAAELHARAVTVFVVHQQRSDAHAANVKNYRVHPDGHYLFTSDLDIADQ